MLMQLVTVHASLIPVLLCFAYYKYRKKCMFEFHERTKFLIRHNCVVTYKNGNISGWVEEPQQQLADGDNICTPENMAASLSYTVRIAFEPLRYFLRTAHNQLQIAMMSIELSHFVDDLIECDKRGVRVQILVNKEMADVCRKMTTETEMKHGIEIRKCESRHVDAIMHHKYVVKDRNCVVFGSMNWNSNSIFNNYENVVFTTHARMCDAFAQNFEQIWACATPPTVAE